MSTLLAPLALLMAAATYPWRAIPLLVPGIHRLAPAGRDYLRLVAPAMLATLAAVNVMVGTDAAGQHTLHVGVEWLAVLLCVVVVSVRRSLLLGLVLAAGGVAVLRALGLA